MLTLSCGPVAPSDGVNNSDVALIMRSCSANGTLLQPDHPAKAIDAQFSPAVTGAPGVLGQVWSSEVVVRDSSSRSRFGSNGFKFAYVLAAMVQHDFALQLWQLGLQESMYVAVEANATATPRVIMANASTGLALPSCDRYGES